MEPSTRSPAGTEAARYRAPVDTAFDLALFAALVVAGILGVPLACAGLDADLAALPGAARMIELGYVLCFGIALPGALGYKSTEGAWVVEPPQPGPGGASGFGLSWERRLGPLTLPGPRIPGSQVVAVLPGGLVDHVTRNGRREAEWSYRAFIATRDGRLLPAGAVHRGAPAAAEADARALAKELGLAPRPAVERRGLAMERTDRGSYQPVTCAEGTATGWSSILAVLATLFGMVGFMMWFGTR